MDYIGANSTSNQGPIILDSSIGHDGFYQGIGLLGDKARSMQQIASLEKSGTLPTLAHRFSHVGIAEVSPVATANNQLGSVEISSIKQSPIYTAVPELSFSHIDLPTVGINQLTTLKSSSLQTRLSQDSASQITAFQPNLIQVGFGQVSGNQTSPTQIRMGQVDTSQVGFDKIGVPNYDAAEVSFPSSIPLQKLFGVHRKIYNHDVASSLPYRMQNL